jgi:guanylate kinase
MGRLIILSGPSCVGKGPLHTAFNVILNHDGEDSENRDAFYYPIGDARKTLFAFAQLVSGKVPTLIEKWDEFLLA